jgi:arylsulfatase A-like enzyme
MPLPHRPPDYEDLLTYWNRLQNRYKYRDQGMDMNLLRTMRAAYYATISFIDYNIGRMLAYLDEESLLDKTLILFTSDHGEFLGDYGSYGKRSFLDVAARVPLLVRYPERFPMATRCDDPVSLVDVLPTCLAVADLPKRPEHSGVDLADVASKNAKRDGILGQFGKEGGGLYMYLTREFKYIYSAPDRKEWLFRRTGTGLEERSLVGNPAFGDTVAQHRATLMERFRNDRYEMPLDGDRWRDYPPLPEIPTNPDAWQLFQDGPSVARQFPPGYAPRVNTQKPYPARGF